MFKDLAFSVFISFTLILRPDCLGAAENTQKPSAKLMTLVSMHEDLISGNLAQETINRSGKTLADETLKFINDPKNKNELKGPLGKNLLKHQTLLMNYLAIKDHLEKCVKKSESKRDLKNRILSASFSKLNNHKDLNVPCMPVANGIKSFVDFNNDVMKAMKTQVAPDFLNALNKKMLINNIKSMIGLRFKFDPNFMKPGYLTQNDLNKLMAETCFKNSCAKIDAKFKNELANEAINFSKTLRDNKSEKRFDLNSATQSINQSIERLNSALNKIKVKKDEGIIFDSANLKDPNTKKEFDEYVYSYMHEVQTATGPLLLTSTLRDKAGELKSFSDDDTKKDKKTAQFKFIPHEKVNAVDVEKSIKEAENKINEAARDQEKIIAKEQFRNNGRAGNNESRNDSRNEDINELVKINPFAVGQILIQNPEYAGLACDAINRIEARDKHDQKMDQYFMIGGAILGGALLLTGVGTMVGAYMITGSVTAGIAAGTVGGTIMSTTMIAGAVTETASAAYFGKKAYDSYEDNDKLEKAIFTNNGDQYSIVEKKEAYLNFKDARMKSMIALASAAFSGVRLDRFFELHKFVTGPLKLNELKATTKIMETIADSKVANKLGAALKFLGSKGGEILDEFLVRLAKVSEKVRLETLEFLKDAKITPEKIKEVLQEALNAAKKCSKV